MTDISKLCMVCLGEKDANGICPDCRKDTDITNPSPLLPAKSILAQRYIIAKARKANGEGFTYSAFDMKLNKAVSVREFFPSSIARREADEITVTVAEEYSGEYTKYLNAFLSLWTKLQRLKGLTALITVTEVFQSGGTAYAVYDESERITLRDYLLDTKEGFISWDKARVIFMPVLSTLGTLHTSGIIHRGINPSSFIFSKEGKLKLTDFSILPARVPSGLIKPEIFDGYAPVEQYNENGKTGASTDIYSFCSVLYRSLIGTTPIDAKTRMQNDQMMIPARFAEQLPPYVINALISGMSLDADERTDNIEQLRSNLSASPRVIGASAPKYTPDSGATQKIPVQGSSPYVPEKLPSQTQFINPPSEAESSRQLAQQELINSKQHKKKNLIIAALTVLLAVMLLIIGILGAALIFGDGTFSLTLFGHEISGGEKETTEDIKLHGDNLIEMPDFRGAKISDILLNPVYNENLTILTVEESSSTVAAGIVIGQNIAPGNYANKGDTVTLTISKGPQLFALQDVTGMTYEEAESIFTSQGLICVKSSLQNDDPELAGKIAETIPPANNAVKNGDTVTIVIYTDPNAGNQNEEAVTGGNSVEDFLEGLETTEPAF